MAGNLGIPPELMKSLKTINSMRNDLAHNPSIQSIADSRIQSLKDTLTEYFKTASNGTQHGRIKTGYF